MSPAEVRAWAVAPAWRGDLKLFGRVVQKIVDEVRATGHPADCSIEFAVQRDRERYETVRDMIELVPAGTLRSFGSARIEVGGEALRVEVSFGRKRKRDAAFVCPLGISLRVVSDGTVDRATTESIRDRISDLLARGGFFWVKPTKGPARGQPVLEKSLARRWRARQVITQGVLLVLSLALLAGLALLIPVIESSDDELDGISGVLSSPLTLSALAIVVPGASYLAPTLIFPAVEIAETTPGRRIIRAISRSGIATTALGVLTAGAKSLA